MSRLAIVTTGFRIWCGLAGHFYVPRKRRNEQVNTVYLLSIRKSSRHQRSYRGTPWGFWAQISEVNLGKWELMCQKGGVVKAWGTIERWRSFSVYPKRQRYFTWPVLGNYTDRAAQRPAARQHAGGSLHWSDPQCYWCIFISHWSQSAAWHTHPLVYAGNTSRYTVFSISWTFSLKFLLFAGGNKEMMIPLW